MPDRRCPRGVRCKARAAILHHRAGCAIVACVRKRQCTEVDAAFIEKIEHEVQHAAVTADLEAFCSAWKLETRCASSTTASPSSQAWSVSSSDNAAATPPSLPVQSWPLRLYKRASPASIRASIRYPSYDDVVPGDLPSRLPACFRGRVPRVIKRCDPRGPAFRRRRRWKRSAHSNRSLHRSPCRGR